MKIEKIIKLISVDQFRDTEDESWKPRACGPGSLKMLLCYFSEEHSRLSIMEIIDCCVNEGGYIEGIGWKHSALVKTAGNYGVAMDYRKVFYRTPEEKEEGLSFINANITAGKPVIASIYHRLSPENGGHLAVVNGFFGEAGSITGYYIQDPDPGFRGSNYLLTRDEFLSGWRGGLIWLA